jgi:hypothetical protein
MNIMTQVSSKPAIRPDFLLFCIVASQLNFFQDANPPAFVLERNPKARGTCGTAQCGHNDG